MAKNKYVDSENVLANFKKIKAGADVPARAALVKSSRPMLTASRRNAPVDEGVLKKSLRMMREKTPPGLVSYLVGATGKARIYAAAVEWGRVAADGSRVPGSRFMTKAFEAESQQTIARFAKQFPAEWEKRLQYLAKKGIMP